MTCSHQFCDDSGGRYVMCQRGCGVRDPFDPLGDGRPARCVECGGYTAFEEDRHGLYSVLMSDEAINSFLELVRLDDSGRCARCRRLDTQKEEE